MHIILASGWGKSDFLWKRYRKWWEAEGITTSTLQAKALNFGPLQAASRQLARQINDLAQPPIIVGHSAGGVIARHCIAKYQPKVAGLITIASPHDGSRAAWLAPWSYSAAQLKPNSNFIRRMEPLPLPECPVLNIVCSHDLFVSKSSAIMPGAHGYTAEVPQTHLSVLLSRDSWDICHTFATECVTADFTVEGDLTLEELILLMEQHEEDEDE